MLDQKYDSDDEQAVFFIECFAYLTALKNAPFNDAERVFNLFLNHFEKRTKLWSLQDLQLAEGYVFVTGESYKTVKSNLSYFLLYLLFAINESDSLGEVYEYQRKYDHHIEKVFSFFYDLYGNDEKTDNIVDEIIENI